MNAKRIYYKNMTREKQDHNKDRYPKLVLFKLKILQDFTSIYLPIGHQLKEASQKTFNLHAHPCVAHVHPCGNQ
jgi:hypothetical protein